MSMPSPISSDEHWGPLIAASERLTGARAEFRIGADPTPSADRGVLILPVRCDRAEGRLMLHFLENETAAPRPDDVSVLMALGSQLLRLVTETAALRLEHSESRHRADNEIQLWMSLLAWQERQTESPTAREALGVAQMRFATIAAARRAIDRSDGRLGAVVRAVCDAFSHYADGLGHMLTVEIDDRADVVLPACQTIALALNELLTNALKHAFAPAERGIIRVRLGKDEGAVRLTVADGGLPFDPRADGTGLDLISRMIQDAGAHCDFAPAEKSFSIVIPIPEAA